MSERGWETLPDVFEWWEALPNVRERLGDPFRHPGLVGTPSRMSLSGRRPSRMSGRGRETIPDVRERLGDPPGCL